MTHSKIFLGAAALVLTGAAALASSNNNRRTTVFYQTTPTTWASTTLVGVCPVGNPTCTQKVIINGQQVTVQLYLSASTAHPLQRQSF